jgi:hypothetical protein
MTFFHKLLYKILLKIQSINKIRLINKIEKKIPGYSDFVAFNSSGNAVGVKGHPWRALDQFKALDASNPKSIVELGSGTSTGIFSHYVNNTENASLYSLDESEIWGDLTQKALDDFGVTPHSSIKLETVRALENEMGTYYDIRLPKEIDLLYIDGPVVKKVEGKKTANQDIIHLFNRGVFPKAIMVDGRHDTVDAILSHEAGKKYSFIPSSLYIARKNMGLFTTIRFSFKYYRHSLLLSKS